MTELSTAPPTTLMSDDLHDTSGVDTTVKTAAQAARHHWHNVPGGKPQVNIGTEASVGSELTNATATTQPETPDGNGRTKPDGTLTADRTFEAVTTPITVIENDQ